MSDIAKESLVSSGGRADPAAYDPAKFVKFYRSNYDDIFRYCVHRLFDRHTAEDVCSEVFLKAARHAGRFEGLDEAQFRGWLYRVATNEINSYMRRTSRRQRLLRFFGQGPEPEMTAPDDEKSEQLERLKKALMSLSPKYQAVITLRFTENLTHEQIAGVLNTCPGTVRSQLSRAIAGLRAKLRTADEQSGGR